ncbi:MAG: hypothetical protein ACR2PJ_01865, partial [Pseudomonadales bacterium]
MLHGNYRVQLERQAVEYGEAATIPLADLFAEYVLHKDMLSLTVLATGLQEQTPIATVEIYDVNQNLLAQVGGARGDYAFSRQLSYQDSIIGHMTITIDPLAGNLSLLALLPPLLILLLMLGALGAVLWVKRVKLTGWILAQHYTGDAEAVDNTATNEVADAPAKRYLLVCKTRPAEQAEYYRAAFVEAIAINQGSLETAERDELTASFNSAVDAIEAALLVQALVAEVGGGLRYGAAMASAGENEAGTHKRLSYLASIADGRFVTDLAAASRVAD